MGEKAIKYIIWYLSLQKNFACFLVCEVVILNYLF